MRVSSHVEYIISVRYRDVLVGVLHGRFGYYCGCENNKRAHKGWVRIKLAVNTLVKL